MLTTYLFPDEHHVHRAAALRLASVDEHVNPSRVAVREAERPDGLDHGLELGSIHDEVYVTRRASSAGVALVHVEKHGHSTDHTVVEAGLSERLRQTTGGIEKLFHVAIVSSDGQHGSILLEYLTRRLASGASLAQREALPLLTQYDRR